MKSLVRRILVGVACLAIVPLTVLISFTCFGMPLWMAEQRIADLRLAAFSYPEPPNKGIVIVAITDNALEGFPYRSPVDRAFLAELLKSVERMKPRAVGVDLLFDRPTEKTKDDLLQKTILEFKFPLVVGSLLGIGELTRDQQNYLANFVPAENRGLLNANETTAWDGVVRWTYSYGTYDGKREFSFSGLLAKKIGIVTSSREFPISWSGEASAFTVISAELVPYLPTAALQDKIVLIGVDEPFEDRVRTPLTAIEGAQGDVAGVVVHAHALATQMSEGTSTTISWPMIVFMGIVFAFVGGGLPLVFAASLVSRLLAYGSIVIAYWVFGIVAWREANLMIPLVIPTFTFVVFNMAAEISLLARTANRARSN